MWQFSKTQWNAWICNCKFWAFDELNLRYFRQCLTARKQNKDKLRRIQFNRSYEWSSKANESLSKTKKNMTEIY